MARNALDVAKVIVSFADEEKGELISNLKVQKLLYYVQGFYYAMHGEPLFNEQIEAWQYGPVVPEVYHEFKRFGSGPIRVSPEEVPADFSVEEMSLISEVYEVYGQFSAVKLMDMTHNESPWQTTSSNEVITLSKLDVYFKTQLES